MLADVFWHSPADGPPIEEYERGLRRFHEALSGVDFALWGRQMVLGPTPEFCVHTAPAVTPPAAGVHKADLALLWCSPDLP